MGLISRVSSRTYRNKFIETKKKRTPGLFVAPIDPRAEEADIDDLFKDFGRVTNIQWKKGHSSNYIFCELDDMDAAEAAMDKLNGRRFFGRDLSVKPANGIGPGKGYRGAENNYDSKFNPDEYYARRDERQRAVGLDKGSNYGQRRNGFSPPRNRGGVHDRIGFNAERRRSRSPERRRTPPRYREYNNERRYGSNGRNGSRNRSRSPARSSQRRNSRSPVRRRSRSNSRSRNSSRRYNSRSPRRTSNYNNNQNSRTYDRDGRQVKSENNNRSRERSYPRRSPSPYGNKNRRSRSRTRSRTPSRRRSPPVKREYGRSRSPRRRSPSPRRNRSPSPRRGGDGNYRNYGRDSNSSKFRRFESRDENGRKKFAYKKGSPVR